MSTPVDRSTLWPYDEQGELREFHYQRFGSPTVAAAESALGQLDGGTALLFPSGAGATTALVLTGLTSAEQAQAATGERKPDLIYPDLTALLRDAQAHAR